MDRHLHRVCRQLHLRGDIASAQIGPIPERDELTVTQRESQHGRVEGQPVDGLLLQIA